MKKGRSNLAQPGWSDLGTRRLEGMLSEHDYKIDRLVVAEGELYALADNQTEGASVFRNEGRRNLERANEPGWEHTIVSTLHSTDQVVFKGHLYFGVVGYHATLVKMVHPGK